MDTTKPYDKALMAHIDVSLRSMVDRSYDLCIYRCSEDENSPMMMCKQACYKSIIVPFRHANHVSKDNEENAYRKCLSKSPTFPAIQQEDFITCSNANFQDRIEVLSNHLAAEATKVFAVSRS
jgi:hypothetical protein